MKAEKHQSNTIAKYDQPDRYPKVREKVDAELALLHRLEDGFDRFNHCQENNEIRVRVKKVKNRIKKLDPVFYSQVIDV